ncbi:MAG: SRPBCC domain-containing protein [Polyangiaceae bacterium]
MTIDPANSGARALADLTAGSVLATVEIAAPAERVFRALTDPRELLQWWGSSDTYRGHRWDADFRVGGRWRVEGKSSTGEPYAVFGEFLEIAPPRRLVQTWSYDWDQGRNHPPTKLTYVLDDVPSGTRLTVRHEGFVDRQACGSHAAGWERVLGWLEDHMERVVTRGLGSDDAVRRP